MWSGRADDLEVAGEKSKTVVGEIESPGSLELVRVNSGDHQAYKLNTPATIF